MRFRELSIRQGGAEGKLAEHSEGYGTITQFSVWGTVLKADIPVLNPMTQARGVVCVLSLLEIDGKVLSASFALSLVNARTVEQLIAQKTARSPLSHLSFAITTFDPRDKTWFTAARAAELPGTIRPVSHGGFELGEDVSESILFKFRSRQANLTFTAAGAGDITVAEGSGREHVVAW